MGHLGDERFAAKIEVVVFLTLRGRITECEGGVLSDKRRSPSEPRFRGVSCWGQILGCYWRRIKFGQTLTSNVRQRQRQDNAMLCEHEWDEAQLQGLSTSSSRQQNYHPSVGVLGVCSRLYWKNICVVRTALFRICSVHRVNFTRMTHWQY